MKKKSKKPEAVKHVVKRCPHCQAYLKPDVLRCDSCNQPVGQPDRHGTAKKPIDWLSYLSAVIAVALFIAAVYWFLLK